MTLPQALTLGALLKRYRMAAGLTQEELAEKAGLSANAIGTLERGISRTPRRDTVVLLAAALGLAPAERSIFERAAHDRFAYAPVSSPPAEMPAARPTDPPALIGRGAELARINDFLSGEGPPVLLVVGEPGIGKTRLLQATAERASLLGWSVVRGNCHRRSASEPYAPFPAALLQFLRARSFAQQRLDLHGCGWLARLLPELTEAGVAPAPAWTLPPEQERRLMLAAVAQLLTNVARPAGTLLVLDDLQWAGADALDLLAACVCDAPEAPRLRVVTVYRDSDVTGRDALAVLAADLARQGSAAHLMLGPLDRSDAAGLLDGLLEHTPSVSRDMREQVLRRAGGVPFFLVSFAHELRAHDASEVAGNPPSPAPLPWKVAASIRQRVALLPEGAQEVVAVVAVATAASRGISHGLLRTVAGQLGQDEAPFVTSVEAAQHGQLLIETEQHGYTCAHELIGEVIRADLTSIRHHLLHRLLGEALETSPESEVSRHSAALAWHFSQAGDLERALPYALRAGDHAAAVYAQREAEQHYQTAVALAREVGDTAHEVDALEKLGILFDNLGRFDEAIAALELAVSGCLALGDRERLARATHRLARACHRAGKVAEGVRSLRALVAHLLPPGADDPLEPPPDLAGPRTERALDALSHGAATRLGISLTTYLMTLSRPEDALTAIERAAAHARLEGDAQLAAHTTYVHGNVLRDLGRLDEAENLWHEAATRARAAGNLDILAIALSNLGLALEARGEFTRARLLHHQALTVATQLGDPNLVAWSRGDLAELAFLMGDWSQARSELEAVLKTVRTQPPGASRAVGLTYGAGMPLALLGRLDLAVGRTDEGLAALDEVLRLSENGTAADIRPWVRQALAEHDLLAGAPELARQWLEPLFAVHAPHASRESALPAMLAWAWAEHGALDRAWQLVEAAAESARAGRLRLVLGETLPVYARVALRAGRVADAVRAAEEALALARALPAPYTEAKALIVRALVHTSEGEVEAAGACYGGALAILRRLGERLYAGPVERALAAMGEPV